MEITIPYIRSKFEEYNRLMFGGSLPMPAIRLSNAKSFVGLCTYRKQKTLLGKTRHTDFTLRFSTRIELSEAEIEDTIIHEMIHYYIGYHQIPDTSTHGQVFRQWMNGINQKYGRHITISHKSSKEQREQAVDKRRHWHVVAVVEFHDGRKGIKVLPRVLQSILKYYNAVGGSSEVASVSLYMSNDIFFNRYPNSSVFKVHIMEPEVISSHLTDADRLKCDGKRIYR